MTADAVVRRLPCITARGKTYRLRVITKHAVCALILKFVCRYLMKKGFNQIMSLPFVPDNIIGRIGEFCNKDMSHKKVSEQPCVRKCFRIRPHLQHCAQTKHHLC